MTKTEARQIAGRHLRLGHFRPTAATAWVTCPLCPERISVEFHPWKGPTPFLRNALAAHLADEH